MKIHNNDALDEVTKKTFFAFHISKRRAYVESSESFVFENELNAISRHVKNNLFQ